MYKAEKIKTFYIVAIQLLQCESYVIVHKMFKLKCTNFKWFVLDEKMIAANIFRSACL